MPMHQSSYTFLTVAIGELTFYLFQRILCGVDGGGDSAGLRDLRQLRHPRVHHPLPGIARRGHWIHTVQCTVYNWGDDSAGLRDLRQLRHPRHRVHHPLPGIEIKEPLVMMYCFTPGWCSGGGRGGLGPRGEGIQQRSTHIRQLPVVGRHRWVLIVVKIGFYFRKL